ncbi:RNA polymerase sigma factor RpoE [Anatilimnocola aggregata]|uniref:RNA polymerase sigma factor RpoE n=1 Tax=Anatilimnocola aggregata TaxID=2528021 RepID=A0A517YNS3_9BACT|nr:sigma-70 family RNA polymerase sigma factor [Anatilimnocola aggregata]QDU31868.1 RNA polymerase sigma factor RpoE [Anatilimnocola aggregata]
MTDSHVSLHDEGVEPTTSRTSLSLLERARSCDQQAWVRIVRLYCPLVYRWCRSRGLQEADAADVGQDVFRAVSAGLPNFRHDSEGCSFRGWLKKITQNKVTDFVRDKRRSPDGRGGSDAYQSLQEIQGEESVDSEALAQETRLLYERALEIIQTEFNQVHWQAFYRTTIDHQSAGDVAQELGLSRQVVYNARSRILRRLREEFAELIGEEDLTPSATETA